MPKPKYLLIGSTEAYSGKSAAILGVAEQLRKQGVDIAYGKPIGTCLGKHDSNFADADVRLVAKTLHLREGCLRPTLLSLDEATIKARLEGHDQVDYHPLLTQYLSMEEGDLVLLEGAGTLEEGRIFGLSLPQIAEVVNASVLLVARFHSMLLVEMLLTAQERLGDRLVGVLLNDVSPDQLDLINSTVRPFLEAQGIPILGVLPRNSLLRSVSVEELVRQLKADVLCRPDRLDLMVESLTIGAMNVNAAMKYFQRARNMAVVTGGDRTDIQLAALETSTQCLILTGYLPPLPQVLSRAEDLEVPILSVDLDTLSTVDVINHTFGQVRLHEPAKLQCIQQLMAEHFDIDRLTAAIGLV